MLELPTIININGLLMIFTRTLCEHKDTDVIVELFWAID